MIVEAMHRHRRLIMGFIFLFIGVPLALMIPGGGSGRSGSAQFDASFPVAQVASTPITAEVFLTRYNQVSQQRSQGGLPASAADLVNDGTIEGILDGLIQEAIIGNAMANDPVYPEHAYLTSRLQEDPFFQNVDGEFDKGFYNQWVQANIDRGFNWDSIYDSMADSVSREVYLSLLGASARVLESELREGFESSRMRLRIKAAAIEPKVELSEEELQKQYDDNLSGYMTPEERRADFMAVSMKPPRPDIVDELIERARSGEDFAELAREHSQSFDKEDGGDLGWIGEADTLPEHQAVITDLAPGEISDAVESPGGIHIYAVVEERTNEEGAREIHARQITIRPQLTDEEKELRTQRAQALHAAAIEENGDIEAAGLIEDVEVETTGLFSRTSPVIDNVSNTDTYPFTQGMASLGVGQVSEVIEARDNLYIGVVTEIIPPIQQTFEEAREQVETDATNLYKNGPEFIGKVTEYTSKILEEAENLESIQELIPELEVEIKETEDFKLTDYLFPYNLLIDTRQIFQLLLDKEPGDIAGPIRDFSRVTYLVELVERIAPDQSVWDAEWEDERPLLHNAFQLQRRFGRQSDYLLFLTEKASNEALIQKDYNAIFKLLGLDDTGADPNTVATPPALEAPVAEALPEVPETESADEEAIVLDLDEEEE